MQFPDRLKVWVLMTCVAISASLKANPPGANFQAVPESALKKLSPFVSRAVIASRRFDVGGAPGLPHSSGVRTGISGLLRVPCFVIWTQDDVSLWNNPDFLKACREEIFSNDPTKNSARNYLNLSLGGKMEILDGRDLIPIKLPRFLKDYFTPYIPGTQRTVNRLFFDDLAAYIGEKPYSKLSGKGPGLPIDLSVFNNDPGKKSENEIDFAVFMLVTYDETIMAFRSWTEATTSKGYLLDKPEGSQPVVNLKPSGSVKTVNLSSFCMGRLLSRASSKPFHIGGNGWIVHESLHCFGLPDLYDLNSEVTGGAGSACGMSWGMYGLIKNDSVCSWNATPILPSAWCRRFLGVSHSSGLDFGQEEASVVIDKTISLEAAGQNLGSFAKIELPIEDGREHYLLVELRKAGTFASAFDWDGPFGSGGFLIWEIREVAGYGYTGTASKRNPFWPMCYMGSDNAYPKGRMNCVSKVPLVTLRSEILSPGNLPVNELWNDDYLWKESSHSFATANVVLSSFNTTTGRFTCSFMPGKGAVGSTNLAQVLPSPPPDLVEAGEHGVAVAPVVAHEGDGKTLDANMAQIHEAAGELLAGVLKAYPNYTELDVREQAEAGVALSLPVSATPGGACRDIVDQLKFMNLKLITPGARSSKTILLADITDDEIKRFASRESESISGSLYLVKDALRTRIRDSKITLHSSPDQKDQVRYEINLPSADIPPLPQKGETISKSEFKENIRSRFGKFLSSAEELGAQLNWDRILDVKSGSTVWQCRVPLPSSTGSVIFEMDAIRPEGGLKNDTPVIVR